MNGRSSLDASLGLLVLMLSLCFRPAPAQAPDAAYAAAANIAAGLTQTQVTTEGEEEAAFEALPKRTQITTVPDSFDASTAFVLRYVAPPPPKKVVVEVPKNQPPPNADVVKKIFAQVRISSISITKTHKIAVVAYLNSELRVHPDEMVLGNVKVRDIERDRVLLQYNKMPPIWIYRVRPGMPAPEVVAEK